MLFPDKIWTNTSTNNGASCWNLGDSDSGWEILGKNHKSNFSLIGNGPGHETERKVRRPKENPKVCGSKVVFLAGGRWLKFQRDDHHSPFENACKPKLFHRQRNHNNNFYHVHDLDLDWSREPQNWRNPLAASHSHSFLPLKSKKGEINDLNVELTQEELKSKLRSNTVEEEISMVKTLELDVNDYEGVTKSPLFYIPLRVWPEECESEIEIEAEPESEDEVPDYQGYQNDQVEELDDGDTFYHLIRVASSSFTSSSSSSLSDGQGFSIHEFAAWYGLKCKNKFYNISQSVICPYLVKKCFWNWKLASKVVFYLNFTVLIFSLLELILLLFNS